MKYLLLVMLCVLCMNTSAQMYKWTDEKGNVYYGDSNNKPKNVRSEKKVSERNTYTSTSFERTNAVTDKVLMYSAEWCGYCKKARKYFVANNIPFTEYDIEKDPIGKRRYRQIGGKGVPVIVYKDQRMNGFSETGFKKIYGDGA